MTENEIGTICIEAAIKVHRELGPGLLESVYEAVLAYELRQRGFTVGRQVPVTITYQGLVFKEAFRADLIVEDKVIIEVKSVEQLGKASRKQLQTYLRLRGCKLGYIFNFGESLMKHGIVRTVNGLEEDISRGDADTQRGMAVIRTQSRFIELLADRFISELISAPLRLCAQPFFHQGSPRI
jgi:GxxExxY protein